MPSFRNAFCLLAACVLLGCSKPKIQLTYTTQQDGELIDFAGSKGWQPQWTDSLIARLERGALPGFTDENKPVLVDSLRGVRKYRGVMILAEGQAVPLYSPRAVRGYRVAASAPPAVDLYFYDQAVRLEFFYARVRQQDLEQLTGAELELVPARK